ncbi:MAG: ATP-binding protein [Armatimonadota bacterium]|nr:ATP-binding protein [Armatimonadota bacterium]
MSMTFQKATKKSARLRMALIGVAGSGKTFTALNIAQHLGGPVALIDTERGSASKYSDVFEFDVLELETFSPQTYIDAIKAAEEAGYNVLIIDSLSHAWTGKEGALDQVTRVTKRSQSGNTFAAWRDVTPMHNMMVDTIIGARLHIIATMRAKTEYVQEKNDKTGKISVRKVGMAPIQRDGLEYEFDVVADLDQDNNLIVGKTRCPAIAGAVFPKAGRDVAQKLTTWLTDGAPGASFKPTAERPPVERAARPAETRPVESTRESTDFQNEDSDIDDLVHCHCGIEAKYVRGKSGNGWVCGHQGTGEPTCDFRLKENASESADGDSDPYEETNVGISRMSPTRETAGLNGHHRG